MAREHTFQEMHRQLQIISELNCGKGHDSEEDSINRIYQLLEYL